MKVGYKRLFFMLLFFLLIGILMRFSGVYHYFSLSALKDENHFLRLLIATHYYYAVALYLFIFIAVIAFAIPGSAALTLLGGYLFGALAGGLYALLGSVIGSTFCFLLFRYFLTPYVRIWYGLRIDKFKQQIAYYGNNYLLMLHFVIIVPYMVINAIAAVTDISLATFIWTTTIGAIPIVTVYAFAGRQLSYIHAVSDIFSFPIIMAFVLLIVMALMPIIIQRYKNITV